MTNEIVFEEIFVFDSLREESENALRELSFPKKWPLYSLENLHFCLC